MFTRIIACFLSVFACTPAFAYYSVLDNGEVLESGRYKLTGDLQVLTESGGGVNGAVRFDLGVDQEYGLRVLMGAGKTDVFFGGLFKWSPIPDVDNQPAIGINIGLLYAKDGGDRDLTLRFEPIVSKKFAVQAAHLTPYASIPFGLRFQDRDRQANSTEVPWQLVAGSQLQLEKWKNLQFMAEVGANLDRALAHVAVAAILYFDTENGISLN